MCASCHEYKNAAGLGCPYRYCSVFVTYVDRFVALQIHMDDWLWRHTNDHEQIVAVVRGGTSMDLKLWDIHDR